MPGTGSGNKYTLGRYLLNKRVTITLGQAMCYGPIQLQWGRPVKTSLQELCADLQRPVLCLAVAPHFQGGNLLFFRADLLGSLVCHEITVGVDLIISIFSRRLNLRCLSLWAIINSHSYNIYIKVLMMN